MFKREKKPHFDEAAAAFESLIGRCYGYEAVTLALTGCKQFQGFNVEDGPRRHRSDVTTDFQADGVVYENGKHERHVKCGLKIITAPHREGSIGWLYLWRQDISFADKNKRLEEATLYLDVTIWDPEQRYQAALWQCLRDAAVSEFRFVHLELGCDAPPGRDVAISQLREKISTSPRKIYQFKLWPSIELPKSPEWGRRN